MLVMGTPASAWPGIAGEHGIEGLWITSRHPKRQWRCIGGSRLLNYVSDLPVHWERVLLSTAVDSVEASVVARQAEAETYHKLIGNVVMGDESIAGELPS